MPPTLHCVRHAQVRFPKVPWERMHALLDETDMHTITQGFHNLSAENYNMHDPSLTPHGESQCSQLFTDFAYPSPSSASSPLVIASPLHRTLATALLAFPTLISAERPIIAFPLIQETSDLPCDTGSDVEVLKQEYGDNPKVDLSLVHEGWNDKSGTYAPTARAIEDRARSARQWLRARTEQDVIVVTHGGLLHYLTGDWAGSAKFDGTGWANCEFRSYRFVDSDEEQEGAPPENAGILETDESRRRRRGTEKPWTKEETAQFKETASKEWEAQGFQRAAEKN